MRELWEGKKKHNGKERENTTGGGKNATRDKEKAIITTAMTLWRQTPADFISRIHVTRTSPRKYTLRGPLLTNLAPIARRWRQ